MEDRKDSPVRRIIGLTLVVVSSATSVSADHHFTWPTDIVVQTNPDSVLVESHGGGSAPGSVGTQVSGGGNCHLDGPGNIGAGSADLSRQRNVLPYTLICDGSVVGVLWLPIGSGGGAPPPAVSPQDIAMSLRERIPIPTVTIAVNPERGLVGIDSWFWIEGYDGRPITASTNAFGSRVDVEARVQRYEWSFGDGTSMTTESSGRPYPERSDVRHVYERSSLGYEEGYPVEVGFFFSVQYRIDGGGWVDLPGIERVAEARYSVRESQAVIHQ
jgi:hypothetical protein